VTPAEADWVLQHVLPARYVPSFVAEGGDPTRALRTCDCQHSACGNCQLLGRHDRCGKATGFHPVVVCDTYLVNRDGNVRAQVWRAGTPCRYICPCPCPQPEPAPAVQLGLFDLAVA
jgi:hypothetical protein